MKALEAFEETDLTGTKNIIVLGVVDRPSLRGLIPEMAYLLLAISIIPLGLKEVV